MKRAAWNTMLCPSPLNSPSAAAVSRPPLRKGVPWLESPRPALPRCPGWVPATWGRNARGAGPPWRAGRLGYHQPSPGSPRPVSSRGLVSLAFPFPQHPPLKNTKTICMLIPSSMAKPTYQLHVNPDSLRIACKFHCAATWQSPVAGASPAPQCKLGCQGQCRTAMTAPTPTSSFHNLPSVMQRPHLISIPSLPEDSSFILSCSHGGNARDWTGFH